MRGIAGAVLQQKIQDSSLVPEIPTGIFLEEVFPVNLPVIPTDINASFFGEPEIPSGIGLLEIQDMYHILFEPDGKPSTDDWTYAEGDNVTFDFLGGELLIGSKNTGEKVGHPIMTCPYGNGESGPFPDMYCCIFDIQFSNSSSTVGYWVFSASNAAPSGSTSAMNLVRRGGANSSMDFEVLLNSTKVHDVNFAINAVPTKQTIKLFYNKVANTVSISVWNDTNQVYDIKSTDTNFLPNEWKGIRWSGNMRSELSNNTTTIGNLYLTKEDVATRYPE